MAAFKRFFVQHGEKVVLALVVLLCLVSVMGTIRRYSNFNHIEAPGESEPFIVPEENLHTDAEMILAHLARSDKALSLPPQEDLVDRMFETISKPVPSLTESSAQWVFYPRPPSTDIAWVEESKGLGQLDPAAEFITGLVPPVEWEIITSPSGTLVLARGPEELLRWVANDQICVALARAEVESVRDDMASEVINEFVHRSSVSGPIDVALLLEDLAAAAAPVVPTGEGTGAGTVRPTATPRPGTAQRPAAVGGSASAGNNTLTGRRQLPGQSYGMESPSAPMASTPETVVSKSPWGSNIDTPAAETVTAVAQAEFIDPLEDLEAFDRLLDQEMRAELEHLQTTVGPGTPGWIMVADRMEMYESRFDEATISEIFRSGRLPRGAMPAPAWYVDASKGAASAEAEKATDETATTTSPAEGAGAVATTKAVTAPTGLAATRVTPGMRTGVMDGVSGAGGAAVKPADQYDRYKTRYFAFFDNHGIKENGIYRYRLVSYSKVRDLPASVRAQPQFSAYMPRAELADATLRRNVSQGEAETLSDVAVGRFALTAEEFREFAKQSEKEPPDALQHDAELMKWDEKRGVLTGMIHPNNLPTKRAASYRRGDFAYSRWTYTSVVVVPPLKRIIARGSPQGEDLTMSFEVRMQDAGKTISQRFSELRRPDAVKRLTWRNWVKTEMVNGKPKPIVNPETGLYELHDMTGFYEQAGRVAPPQIGGVVTKARVEYDFRTNWGLLDVRRGLMTTQRYKVNEEDGTRTPQGRPVTREISYAVIRELEAPQGRPVQYKILPIGVRAASAEMDVKFDWEPQLTAELAKMAQSGGISVEE